MRHPFSVVLALVLSCWVVCGATDQKAVGERAGDTKGRTFIPDRLDWKDGPPSLPPGAKFVVLEGDPNAQGYFAMRLQLPNGYKVPPHWHPNVERITVISGRYHLGMGERFHEEATRALPAGSYVFREAGTKQFAWAEGETVIQLTTIGPWAINYTDPSDDPRRQKK
jgi:quercetin dioxygenase-like cupin family protein